MIGFRLSVFSFWSTSSLSRALTGHWLSDSTSPWPSVSFWRKQAVLVASCGSNHRCFSHNVPAQIGFSWKPGGGVSSEVNTFSSMVH